MDVLKQKMDYSKHKPTLSELNKYFDDLGLVGDEETRLILSIAIIRRLCVGVVSLAGSGKTAITDAVLSLFRPQQIYTLGASSDKAQLGKQDKINSASVLHLTELQKAAQSGDTVIEMLKDLGEGKDYVRDKAVKGGQEIEVQRIKAGKAILYTKAIENKFDSDAELDRRFPRVTTDISQQQNKRVIRAKATRRSDPFKKKSLSETATNAVQFHMAELLKEGVDEYVFINPLADYIAEYIPSTFAISRTFTDHYFNMMDGVAFFNKHKRLVVEKEVDGKKKKLIFITPEDCFQAHSIYGKQFLQDVMNLPPNGMAVIDAFKYAKDKGISSSAKKKWDFGGENEEKEITKLTLSDLFKVLKTMGFVMKEQVIIKMLDALKESGYIYEDISNTGNLKNPEYYLTDEAIAFDNFIDWNEAISAANDKMRELFPEYYGQYRDFCVNEFENPFTGEITKYEGKEATPRDSRDDWIEAA